MISINHDNHDLSNFNLWVLRDSTGFKSVYNNLMGLYVEFKNSCY